MGDKIRELGIAVTLIAMWFALAILVVKYMKLSPATRRAQSDEDDEDTDVKEDWYDYIDEPPSYAEVMRQDNRIECV